MARTLPTSVSAKPEFVARNDYVACAGSLAVLQECYGPSNYQTGSTTGDGCWSSNDNNKMNGLTVLPRSGLIGIKDHRWCFQDVVIW